MNSTICTSYLSLPPRRNIPLPESPFLQLPPRFDSPSRLIGFLNISPANSPLITRLWHDSAVLRGVQSRRIRVSSRDAQFGSFSVGSEAQAPSFGEFITSERVKVVAMLALALALCNADRVVMSVAIVPLSLSNGWSRSFAGIVQSSFLWGYLVSPVAGGTLVDYYGGKVVMAWGVALWSMATFLTPWAAETSLWLLLAMRALLGIAEGVALPCMNNMVARWFPKTERSRAVGIAMAGFQLGSSVGLMLSPILMSQGGVFGPFVIFGLSGFLWVLVWLSATSSAPDRSPQISKYELDYIQSGRQKSFLGENKPKTTKGFFVFLSWMPIYFNSVYHVDLRQAAWFSAVPWTVMAVMGYIGGLWSDIMIRNGTSVTLTRKIMQSIGFLGPGISLVGLATAKSPSVASAWLTLAVGFKSFSHSGFLVNLQEIAPQYSGVLHGISNTAGTFAAIVGTVGAGFLGTVGAGFFVELVHMGILITNFVKDICKCVSKSNRYDQSGSSRPKPQEMKKAQSPYNQRNQFSNFHCEDDRNNKTKQQSGSYSALKNIKAAVKKVFTVLLFRRKVNSKAAASVIDPIRNSNRIRGVSSSTDRSSGSTDTKNSSKFKSSGSYGSSTTLSGIIETKNFSYEEISEATEKFSQANIIGEGGFGTVYRGRLGDGSLVAVKRARKTASDKLLQLEFKNEILTLSMIEHLNLVRLYGYLEHGDERIILVEYVGNGTLREHLDGTRGNGLEIAERLDIVIDVAHAITYLHMYTDPPIIHRDIKSLNILITEKLRAKVADFGFARLSADSDATHISTQVKGTAGYLDPEYLKTYQLTEKSDVYSFGVLLVELMTGRRPIEPNKPNNERLTTRWAFQTLKRGEAVLVMDPRLRRNAASTMAMEKILRLAHECLAPLRQSRPSMKKCGEVLWGIRKEYRQVAFPPPPTSHYSANFPVRDPKMTRQQTFGIEDDDNYKFVSA